MSRAIWRLFMCSSVAMLWLLAGGCNEREDTRTTDEKMYAPIPDVKTRVYFACPKCGAPQRPYRITEIKSYYRCSGNPPKFPYHSEHLWQRTLDRSCDKPRTEY